LLNFVLKVGFKLISGLMAVGLNIGQDNLRIKMSQHPAHKPLEFFQSFRLILLIPLKG